MLVLLVLAFAGPYLITSYDIDKDGSEDSVYWQGMIHPVAHVSELVLPPTYDFEVYVKSKGKMALAGRLEDASAVEKFWMTDKPTATKKIVFKATIHDLIRYFGISKKFKLFEIPAETFA